MTPLTTMIDFDTEIAKLEQAVQDGANVWDDAVNTGMELNKSLDTRRFELGDLAVLVGKKYGQDTIGKFATDIGVGKKRLQEYRTVAHFYSKNLRTQIFERFPSLTYSHLRTGMKLPSPVEVMTFLEECATNDWSVEKAELAIKDRAGQPLPPEKLIEASVVVTSTDPHTGTMTFKFTGGLFPVDIGNGAHCRLTLHAAAQSVAVQS